MSLRPLQIRVWFVFVRLQIRVDEFDEAVQVLDRDRFVLLVKIVDVAVQDLDEQLHGHCCVHAGICNTEGAL